MERPSLRIENGFNAYRKLSEKQLALLLKFYKYDEICEFTYEKASRYIKSIIDAMQDADVDDDWNYDGLPNS